VGEWCALARPLLRTSPSVTRPGSIVFDGPVEAFKDGRSWPIGTAREVNWIVNRTTEGPSITVAIPRSSRRTPPSTSPTKSRFLRTSKPW
jgi:hypothetical protein